MRAVKAFGPGTVCRTHQFTPGLNVTDKANCRENGFHCAENPIDCMSYYSWDGKNEFWLVEAGGDIDEDGCDSKISCTQLTLIQRLTLREYAVESAKYMIRHPERDWKTREYGSIRVMKDRGETSGCGESAVIVYGEHPEAVGKQGDTLILIQREGEKVTAAKWITLSQEGWTRCRMEKGVLIHGQES